MSELKISDYIDVDSIDGTELILVSKDGSYRKTTIEEIRNLASDIANTALADLLNKAASAQDIKNILNAINNNFENITSQLSEIKHLNVAYVETWGDDSTAVLGQIGKPFKTINAVLDVIPIFGGYNIMIGMGIFAPIDYKKIKDNISFIGTKKPNINSGMTALENGTIIQGYFRVTDHHGIVIKNLGCDYGLDVANNLYNGNANNALSCGSSDINKPIQGLVIDNIITLAKDATCLFHSCLIEGVTGAVINNIETHYGTHGFVLKGKNCNVGTIEAWDSSTDGIIIRSSPYALCSSNNFDKLIIRSTSTPYGGLTLDGDEDAVNLCDLNINNLIISNCSYGIKFYASTIGSINQVNINNVTLDYLPKAIEFLGQCNRINIGNVIGVGLYGDGITFSNSSSGININNVKLVSIVTNTVGVKLNGNKNTIENLTLEGFTTNWNFGGNSHNISNSTLGTYIGSTYGHKLNNCDIVPFYPTLGNNYANTNAYNSQAKFYKENNTLFLEGMINVGTLGSSTPIFILPEGYRPIRAMSYIVSAQNTYAKITIDHLSGAVICDSCDGSYFSLDGIKFRCA